MNEHSTAAVVLDVRGMNRPSEQNVVAATLCRLPGVRQVEVNVTVLPIVMNTAEQIRADMAANGVRTPFLIDADGSVSTAYGTIGKGMHAGLPGHSFVLIDTGGTQRWYGEYPSMYLSASDLLKQVREHLPKT